MAGDAASGDGSESEGGRGLRADARRNRARILAAAWRLLSVKDPSDLSMEEVARAADIGKGTLYRHYPTKESLMNALVLDGSQQIVDGMRDKVPPEADAATKLRAVINFCYDMYENYHLSFDLLAASWHCARDADDPNEHPIAISISRMRDIIEQGMREGAFRALDAEYAAAAVFSVVSPMAYLKQRRHFGYDRAQIQERATDFIMHALASR